ncbi:MAG: hypothetical protein E3J71_09005 [Candidatus Stahlbacteria bacterium]|nr:MAG: hypothetical protein E3J71_09005 [Candidatus Stahlbacteria bacterium]
MKKTIILLTAAVFVAAFVLACCRPERFAERVSERVIEKALEKEGGGDVDINVGGDATVPKDMPKELVYPGAKVTSSLSMQKERKQVTNVSFETRSSVTRVTTYYKGLSSKGWESVLTVSGTEGAQLVLKKGEMGAVITVGETDGKTVIGVLYGEGLDE